MLQNEDIKTNKNDYKYINNLDKYIKKEKKIHLD